MTRAEAWSYFPDSISGALPKRPHVRCPHGSRSTIINPVKGAIVKLTLLDQDGLAVVEGLPDEAFMSTVADVDRVIEACLSNATTSVLLYAENLTGAFFDLSSGEAGAILQKLRNYRMRLAVVCAPGRVQFSSRFGEMLAEERRGRHFGVFETHGVAREWLNS